MRKTLTALLAVLFVSTAGAATHVSVQENEVEPDPGLIDASHPLYPAEKAVDTARINANLISPGEIAQERASEAAVAFENNDTEAGQDALDDLNRVAERATDQSTQGLEKAEQILNSVKEQTPDAANEGIETALSNIQQAKDRVPDDIGNRSGSGGGSNAPI